MFLIKLHGTEITKLNSFYLSLSFYMYVIVCMPPLLYQTISIAIFPTIPLFPTVVKLLKWQNKVCFVLPRIFKVPTGWRTISVALVTLRGKVSSICYIFPELLFSHVFPRFSLSFTFLILSTLSFFERGPKRSWSHRVFWFIFNRIVFVYRWKIS